GEQEAVVGQVELAGAFVRAGQPAGLPEQRQALRIQGQDAVNGRRRGRHGGRLRVRPGARRHGLSRPGRRRGGQGARGEGGGGGPAAGGWSRAAAAASVRAACWRLSRNSTPQTRATPRTSTKHRTWMLPRPPLLPGGAVGRGRGSRVNRGGVEGEGGTGVRAG